MSGIADEKVRQKRSDLHAALAKMIVPTDENLKEGEKKKFLQEMVDGCCQALFSDADAESAEPVGELVRNLIRQTDLLGDVQKTLSYVMMQDLTAEEALWLQPRLTKVLADMANGYCRTMRQEELKRRADLYASHIEQIEKNRLELSELRTRMDSFVSLRMREFMETNFRLEKEIRDHKKARAALTKSEHRYRTLAESARDYIFIINKSDKIEYLNDHAIDLFKRMRKEPARSKRSELLCFPSKSLQSKFLKKVFATAEPLHRQDWTVLSGGRKIFLDTQLVPLLEKGKIRAVLGISRDLTAQKLTEDKIADQERKYHTLFDAIHNAIFLLDGGQIIDCNQSATRIFALPREQLIHRHFHALFSNNDIDAASTRAFIEEQIASGLAGHDNYFELNYVRPDKEILNFEVHFSRIQESEAWHVLAVVRDITQYKKATEAIHASETRFRDIIRRSLDGYFFVDANYHITQLNAAGERILTCTKEELNERLTSNLQQAWNKKLHRVLQQAMEGRFFSWEEFDYIDKNGAPRWVAINARRVHNDGAAAGVEGFIKDITLRKKTEIELIENEARYRALFENTPFDVFGLTLDRRFLKINQNFQRNWGCFEGRQLQSFKPTTLARLMTELCEKVVVQQKTLELLYRKRGKSVCSYFRIILAPIITEEKVMIGFVGLIIDTTDTAIALQEKSAFAEKLIQTSEEEQRRISRDIHDSFGQSLFALQLDIAAAKATLRNDSGRARDSLENSEALLSALMKETSDLCHRLSPRLLDDFGIVEALDDLVENIEMTGALHIDFEKNWLPHKKNKSLETALYRVSQEGMANVLKHSHASHVQMRLQRDEDGISLSIHDDGKGFDLASALNSKKKGFGLMNMKERIDLIGGTFTLRTAPNAGTKIDITIPSRTKDSDA